MNLERARLVNPERGEKNVMTEKEREVMNLLKKDEFQKRTEFQIVTYEYVAPFKYPNFKVELGDRTKGAEFNPDGVELDVPPYGAITFVEEEPIVGVSVIASSCCAPATVYLHCEPVEWKYPRTGVKFKSSGHWGEHVRIHVWRAGISEEYKKCGLFSADFSIPDSRKVTIMGHGSFDIEQQDYDKNHYDAHLTVRIIRVHVKRKIG